MSKNFFKPRFIFLALIASFLIKSSVFAAPEIVHELNFPDFKSRVLRFGNLDGGSDIEFVAVQSIGQRITWLGAYKLSGEELWQIGQKNLGNSTPSFDLALQVFDWDGDNISDVVVVFRNQLQIRRGSDGAILAQVRTPKWRNREKRDFAARDAIFVADLLGTGRPCILLKNRYRQFWIYDHNLRQIFRRKTSTGHFPTSADLDGDGIEDLIIGYEAWNLAKRVKLWQLKRKQPIKFHNDAVDYDDEHIAIATSRDSILLDYSGKLIFSKTHRHSQHAVLWNGLASYVDRGESGRIFTYNKAGELLWTRAGEGRLSIISQINHWQDEPALLLFRRDSSANPILLSSAGEQIAEFPFSSSSNQVFVQHFDFMGDSREELIVYNEEKLAVFQNSAPAGLVTKNEQLPNKRISNASFYIGMQ